MAREVVYTIRNPSDVTQGYKLWNTGQIDAFGVGTPTISYIPDSFWQTKEPAVALQIYDWGTGAGWMLDYLGGITPLNGAIAANVQSGGYRLLPYAVDFVMDPRVGTGQGYMLGSDGLIWTINGSPAVAFGPLFSLAKARRLYARWTGAPGPMYVLDSWGTIYNIGGAPAAIGTYYDSSLQLARDYMIEDWATGVGYVMTGWGSIHPVNHADEIPGGPYWRGWDIATSLARIDTNPDTFTVIDGLGMFHTWIVSTAPTAVAGTVFGPANPTTDTTRPILTYIFQDKDGNSMLKSQLVLHRWDVQNSFVNEKQTITKTATLTGGSFKLALEGKVTSAINYTDSAATVEGKLRTELDYCADVLVTGGPLNTGPMTVEFEGFERGHGAQRLLTVVSSTLTGGSVKTAVSVAGSDPYNEPGYIYRVESDDPENRAVIIPFDLDGGDGSPLDYCMFVRVCDTSLQWSGWSRLTWTQNTTRPDAPSITPVDRGGLNGIGIGLTVTNFPDGALLDVQYTDELNVSSPENSNWQHVRNAVTEPASAGGTGGAPLRVGDFGGVNGWPLEDGGGSNGNNIAKLVHLGGKWLRFTEEWDWQEPTQGAYDFSTLASYVSACHAYGIKVCTSILGAPAWANPHSGNAYTPGGGYPNIPATNKWLPIDDTAIFYAALYCVALVDQAGLDTSATGDIFEIGNEPNIEQFNAGLYQDPAGPYYQGPAHFAKFVKVCTWALRSNYPNLRIMSGGLATVGDVYAPQSGGNRIDLSPSNFWLAMVQAEPELLTTAKSDFTGIHTYNYGGGETAYPDSLPNTTKGWSGHVQGDKLRDVMTYIGYEPNIAVTETGAPGALPTSSTIDYGEDDSMVAAGYTETFQAYYHALDAIEIMNRVADGRYKTPFFFHTLSERTASSGIERYYGVFRSGPSSLSASLKPAGQVWKDKFSELILLSGPSPASIVDLEAPFGKPRSYRAHVYTVSPWLSSPWTQIVSATLTENMWALSDPGNPIGQMKASVIPPFDFDRTVVAKTSYPSGSSRAEVMRDGAVKGISGTLKVRVIDAVQVGIMEYLLGHDGALLLRDPFGHVWYIMVSGDVSAELIRAGTSAGDPAGIRQVYEYSIPFAQVTRPIAAEEPPASFFLPAG